MPSARSGRSQDSSMRSQFKLISRISLEGSSEDSFEDTPMETTIFLGFFFTIVYIITVFLILKKRVESSTKSDSCCGISFSGFLLFVSILKEIFKSLNPSFTIILVFFDSL